MIVVKLGNIEQINVIINPAHKFPDITIAHVCQKLNPSITPIHVPVHTPVSGRGIATKTNNPSAFNNLLRLFFFCSSESHTISR